MRILQANEVPKRPSNLPTGARTPKYDEVITVVSTLQIGQAVELDPAEFEIDLTEENAVEKFRTNIASTVRRHIVEPAVELYDEDENPDNLVRFMTYALDSEQGPKVYIRRQPNHDEQEFLAKREKRAARREEAEQEAEEAGIVE